MKEVHVTAVLPDQTVVAAAINDMQANGFELRFCFGVNTGVMIIGVKDAETGRKGNDDRGNETPSGKLPRSVRKG